MHACACAVTNSLQWILLQQHYTLVQQAGPSLYSELAPPSLETQTDYRTVPNPLVFGIQEQHDRQSVPPLVSFLLLYLIPCNLY